MAPRITPPKDNSATSDSSPSDAHPVLTRTDLLAVTQKMQPGQCPTPLDIENVCSVQQGALHKIDQMNASARPDKVDRIRSATDTIRITFDLSSLMVTGQACRNVQQKKARCSKPRADNDPLNDAIDSVLKNERDKPTRDVLDALPHFNDPQERELKILEISEVEKGKEFFRYAYRNGRKKMRPKRMTLKTFAVRVSRRRQQLPHK